ncbi:hypothetical protein ONZ45_g14305 [Pleurotus djamor]|nr:hypothetical protein ONZ45_g14305 [Pleurotus djamor]
MSNPRPPSSATTSARSRQRPDLTRATATTTSRTTTTTSRLATTQAAKPTTSRLINGKAASGTSSKEISKKSPSNAGSTNGSSQNALKRSRDNAASASSPSPRQRITESSSSKTSLRASKSEGKPADSSSNKPTPASSSSNTLSSLQLAAQIYPWTYMTASLEVAMSKAEITAQESFAAKEKELDEQEAGIADLRIRYEIECVLALYDELGKRELVDALPPLLDTFIDNALEATRLSDEALRLASLDVTQVDFMSPVITYNTILDSLDDTLKQTNDLSSSFTDLIQVFTTPCPTEDTQNPYDPRPRLSAAFSALLSVLQARHANLTLSQEVVLVLKDNVEAHLRVESLRLAAKK